MKLLRALTIGLGIIGLNAHAGNLINGQWQPVNCGQGLFPPTINTKGIDDYNQSIRDINAWQTKAQEYYNCVVKEANIDNQIIVTTANSARMGLNMK